MKFSTLFFKTSPAEQPKALNRFVAGIVISTFILLIALTILL